VATISGFLYAHGANILHADQHRDDDQEFFFMRMEWSLCGFDLAEDEFRREFGALAARFDMRWQLKYSGARPRIAIFVSRYLHCLADLLHRHAAGELVCDIPLVISNHRDAAPLASFYGIPFHHVPVDAHTRTSAEQREIELLEENAVDVAVLARYMQVLSPEFVARYPRRIINVHHSFLPAFTGGRPYQGAFQRGVKLIGATSHYVTEVLDDGPIIEQDVVRVSHRDQVSDRSCLVASAACSTVSQTILTSRSIRETRFVER
jgi:formyltetrahydrofolate deformylase